MVDSTPSSALIIDVIRWDEKAGLRRDAVGSQGGGRKGKKRAITATAEQGYLGRTDADIAGAEEGARLTALKQEVLQSGVGTRVETIVTFRGEAHHFDLTLEPLRAPHGDIVGTTCACADITPIKRGGEERERLIRELQEALALVTRPADYHRRAVC
jgi:hypothetical protein